MDKKYVRYDEVLSVSEILNYALMIDKFEEGEIDYKKLQALFLDSNHSLKVEPYDISKVTITKEKWKLVKERYLKGEYLPSDIRHYIIDGNIIFYMDYKAIEVLANAGVPKYQSIYLSILKWELRNNNQFNDELQEKINGLESKILKK